MRLTSPNIWAPSYLELSYSVLLGVGIYSENSLPDVANQLIKKQTKTLQGKNHFLILFHTPSIEEQNNNNTGAELEK